MRIGLLFAVALLWGCAGLPAPQEVAAESIGSVSQTSNVVTNEMEPWILGVIILLAGWAIPSPGEMLRGLFHFLGGIRRLFRG
jgi:uncharacterized membrane protein AbrB (regulator of aidB expression)